MRRLPGDRLTVIYRIRGGRIGEEWAADDIAAIMYQLGAFSPPWLG